MSDTFEIPPMDSARWRWKCERCGMLVGADWTPIGGCGCGGTYIDLHKKPTMEIAETDLRELVQSLIDAQALLADSNRVLDREMDVHFEYRHDLVFRLRAKYFPNQEDRPLI